MAAGRRKQVCALEEQKTIILVPHEHDFPLARAKRILSKWLDDCTTSGAEVESRLVTTEVAYGNRDDRLVISLAALRGRRLAFFYVVVGFAHALIDELPVAFFYVVVGFAHALIDELPGGFGQGRTAVRALNGTRKLPGCGSASCVMCCPMRTGKRR